MKKRKKYSINDQIYDTFKEMKAQAFRTIGIETKIYAYEICEDEITKTYKITKTERKIIIEKKYDAEEEKIKEYERKQLSLW